MFPKNEQYFVVCAMVVDEIQEQNLGSIIKHLIYRKNLKSLKDKELHAKIFLNTKMHVLIIL